MSNLEISLQSSVQLIDGPTQTMIVSEINEATKKTLCVWYDAKTRSHKEEWIPSNVLKLAPEKQSINKEDLFQLVGYRRR